MSSSRRYSRSWSLSAVSLGALLAAMPAFAEEGLAAREAGTAFKVDNEYRWSGANTLIKAGDAHQRGYTGAGVTVAVFDSGLSSNLREFAGRTVTGYDALTGRVGVGSDSGWHGTFVSGIIGAARDGIGMEGVAYDARILSVKVIDSRGSVSASDHNIANGINYARFMGASIYNNSWNTSATIGQVSKATFDYYYGKTITAWRNAVANNAIVVFAAGNEGNSQVGAFAALPTYYADLKKGWIAAVATDANGVIASWSNRCGAAADWCLAAVGSNVISTYTNGGYAKASGTSFAAPAISGGAAILKQMWPRLSNERILSIMFTTANKSGIYAQSAIYGQGMLDLEKATRPIGTVGVATPSGKATSSLAVASSAFGAAMGKSVGLVTVVDDYNRDYTTSAGSFVVATQQPYDLERGLRGLGRAMESSVSANGRIALTLGEGITATGLPRNMMVSELGPNARLMEITGVNAVHLTGGTAANLDRAGMLADGRQVGSAFLGLAGDDMVGLSAAARVGDMSFSISGVHGTRVSRPSEWDRYVVQDPNQQVSTASVTGTMARLGGRIGEVALAGHAGVMNESGTVLGSASEGAYSMGAGATTTFFGIGFDAPVWPALGVSAFGGWELGHTRARDAGNSLISGLETTTTAFHVGLDKRRLLGDTDRVTLLLSQPLRVSGGRVDVLSATQDANGDLAYSQSRRGLTTEGREIDLQAGYQVTMDVGTLTAAGLARFQPDNIRDAETELVGMVRYGMKF
jgi:hypothetical protein